MKSTGISINNREFQGVVCILLTFLLCFLATVVISGSSNAQAVGLFSNCEAPFGKSYDDWISEYMNWHVGSSAAEATPTPGG